MTDQEYAAWLEASIEAYAADKTGNKQWPAESAMQRARTVYRNLLPDGPASPDQHLRTILDPEGAAVGTLWFAEMTLGTRRVAYVYDVIIAPAHRRRGLARRALVALEAEAVRLGLEGVALHVFGHNTAARALYEKLGFETTDINMFKALPPIRD